MNVTIWKRASVLAHASRLVRVVGLRGFSAFGLMVGTVAAASGACSSSPTAEQLYVKCALNSDCDPGLICTIGLVCRPVCKTSADCASGGSCVTDDSGHAVCRSPAENDVACDVSNTCPAPLVCASDYHCRDTCVTDSDCNVNGATGRKCALDLNNRSYCADPPELSASGVIADTPPHLLDGAVPATPAPPPDASVSPEGSTGDDGGGTDGTTAPDMGVGASMDSGEAAAPDVAQPVDAGDGGVDAPSAPTGIGFTPSNLSLAGVNLVEAGAQDDPSPGQTFPAAETMTIDGSLVDVYVVKSLVVESTFTLTFQNPRPVVIIAQTTVDIQGKVLLMPGFVGGFSPAIGGNPGPGVGQASGVAGFLNTGAGGASYCGAGGQGGYDTPPAADGGATYGTATLVPLVGGSAGGSGECGLPGGGGGALQIIAGTSIIVRSLGSINAGGGGGGSGCGNYGGPGGGGAGGAILLEAPMVTILGTLAANGGGGAAQGVAGTAGTANNLPSSGGSAYAGVGSAGATIGGGNGMDLDAGAPFNVGGGGGAGRIRINTNAGNFVFDGGIISPDLSTGCATAGPLQ
jgi:hypothetical protein